MHEPQAGRWIANYDDGVLASIDPDAFDSVSALIDAAVARYRDAVAIEASDGVLSYAALDDAGNKLAAHWWAAGLRKGDRVAMILPNLAACAVVLTAAARSGLIQVNCNPRYTAAELEQQLRDAEPAAVVLGGEAVATWTHVAGKFSGVDVVAVGCDLAGGTRLDRILGSDPGRFEKPTLSGADIMFLQYTGGTTGVPKAAILTHRNVVAGVLQVEAWYGANLPPGDTAIVTALPLYHVFALVTNLLLGIKRGGRNRLADAQNGEGIVAALRAAPCALFAGVNSLFAALLEEPELGKADFSRLRTCLGGGAPIEAGVDQRWTAATGRHIRQGYGLTESTGTVTASPDRNDFDGSVGLPLPSTEVRILGDDGTVLPAGEPGELVFRGPQATCGYWRRPEDSHQAFTQDGFVRTGDIASMDARGFVHIVDRRKDIILVSGFNVYPAEVEKVVGQLRGVRECACVGVADDRCGQVPVLFVVVAPGEPADEEAVTQHCSRNLAPYKRPRHLHFIESLPRSGVGKILRRALGELHQQRKHV